VISTSDLLQVPVLLSDETQNYKKTIVVCHFEEYMSNNQAIEEINA